MRLTLSQPEAYALTVFLQVFQEWKETEAAKAYILLHLLVLSPIQKELNDKLDTSKREEKEIRIKLSMSEVCAILIAINLYGIPNLGDPYIMCTISKIAIDLEKLSNLNLFSS
jgi:hypothetical protein